MEGSDEVMSLARARVPYMTFVLEELGVNHINLIRPVGLSGNVSRTSTVVFKEFSWSLAVLVVPRMLDRG